LPVQGVAVVAGTALPEGADAVLPLHLWDGGCALATVAPGHGVSAPDPLAVPAGTVLRPPHLALLARRGLLAVEVVRRPRVALRVAGPKAGADALTPMLQAMITAEGGVLGEDPDLVLHAGRSGPGPDDNGISRFDGVFAHGVLIRPGETSALGTVSGVPALLLPGDPLACATAFALLAAPALRRMGGRPEPAPAAAALTRKIVSGLGQVDAVRVRLADGKATPLGPTLSAAAEADGLVLVPEGSEGYPAGATVAIYPLPNC
jgi:molybdopterin molybdotransferase